MGINVYETIHWKQYDDKREIFGRITYLAGAIVILVGAISFLLTNYTFGKTDVYGGVVQAQDVDISLATLLSLAFLSCIVASIYTIRALIGPDYSYLPVPLKLTSIK